MSLEQDIANLVAASNELTSTVSNKIVDINNKVQQAQSEFADFIKEARSEYAIARQSKNQFGTITGTDLDFFAKNSRFNIEISLYREITSGIPWNDRDAEEQEILRAMGRLGVQHFQPNIRIMKMVWSGANPSENANYTIFPNPILASSSMVTVASYARLISGSINGYWLQGVNSEWGVCGAHFYPKAGRYIHAHPGVTSEAGEVHFIWAAGVSGYVPLDRNNPQWGYYPAFHSEHALDQV